MTTEQVGIGQLARMTGVSPDTVRYYERMKLLPPARRAASGYRYYAVVDVERLRFIRRAKELGFTLREITELLALATPGMESEKVIGMASSRIKQLEEKIVDLTMVRDVLAEHVGRCSITTHSPACPIIEALLAMGRGGRPHR